MNENILDAERQYLSSLLEAIQRCVYFLHASDNKIDWPLDADELAVRKKDEQLFESLIRHQRTLCKAARHSGRGNAAFRHVDERAN